MLTSMIYKYLSIFLLVMVIALASLSVYRGEVIRDLQADLLVNRDSQIKVIIDTTEMANKISHEVQNNMNTMETVKEKHTHEVERIIKEPIYLSTCFDTAGLSILTESILAPYAGEHKQPMPGTASTN